MFHRQENKTATTKNESSIKMHQNLIKKLNLSVRLAVYMKH